MKTQLPTIRKLFVLASQEFLLILPPSPLQNKPEPTWKKIKKDKKHINTKRTIF